MPVSSGKLHGHTPFYFYVAITNAAARQIATIVVPTAQRPQIIRLGTHTSWVIFLRFAVITAEIAVKPIAHRANIIIFSLTLLGIDAIVLILP